MKRIIHLLPICLVGCTTPAEVQIGDLRVRSSGRAGGQGTLYVRHGATEISTSDNNEDSFRELNKTARFTGGVMAATNVANGITDAIKSVKNTTTAAGVTNTAAQEATKQAAITAEVEAARIAADSALVLPPVPSL
jgi:hypothetical protein